jgi:hypothetical protein
MKFPSLGIEQNLQQRFDGPYSEAWRAALERMRAAGTLARRRDRDREARERWDGEGGSLPSR